MSARQISPNQRLIQELEVLKREANAFGNIRLSFTYSKAIQSLREHPTEITSGQEAMKLKGIGAVLAKKIDEILNRPSAPTQMPIQSVPIPPVSAPFSISQWLNELGLSCYLDAFVDTGYDNVLACEELTEKDLDCVSESKLIKPGHRKALLVASKELKQRRTATNDNTAVVIPPPPPPPVVNNTPITTNVHPAVAGIALPNTLAKIPKVLRTNNGGFIPKVSLNFIQSNASTSSVDRGYTYFKEGKVLSLILDGTEMKAQVQGSDANAAAYNVTFQLCTKTEKVSKAMCVCPYTLEGWCKHIVAVLIALTEDIGPLLEQSKEEDVARVPKKRNTSGTKRQKLPAGPKEKRYVPSYRSGAWALLVALHDATQSENCIGEFLNKRDLIARATPLCDASFVQDGKSFYSAWNSMATLIKKHLVIKQKNPPQYSLTEEGVQLARELHERRDNIDNTVVEFPKLSPMKAPKPEQYKATIASIETEYECSNNIGNTNAQTGAIVATSKRSELEEDLHLGIVEPKPALPSNTKQAITNQAAVDITTSVASDPTEHFTSSEIILFLDYREIKKKDHKHLYKGLKQTGIKVEKRNLDLGDIMWVARKYRDNQLYEEIALDFIVERKKLNDLTSSIEDGRYKEQKFRLKKCGLKHPIYLVEGSMDGFELSEKVEDAMAATEVEDGFFIQRTQTEEETIAYLVELTRHLITLNKKNSKEFLSPFTYDEFCSAMSKSANLTLSDLFAKQLLQFGGCTPEKAVEIVGHYATPKRLLDAYKSLDDTKKMELLKNIEYGPPAKKRKIGAALSKTIHHFYHST